MVWQSYNQDGSEDGIFGQRYSSGGAPQGPEFQVNTYTTADQSHPSVAADGTGNFVWHTFAFGGIGDIFGQRDSSGGAPLGSEFRVNTYTTNYQSRPAVAGDSAGNFVVVWESATQDGSSYGIFGQRYDSGGAPLGPEFQVNTYTTLFQRAPAVAVDGAGNFVVVWQSLPSFSGNLDVLGQRYNSSGVPQGPEFRVNTYSTNQQYYPGVAADSTGNFVVVWQSYGQDGSNTGSFAQRYSSGGAPQGAEFRVNTYTTEAQSRPSVAYNSTGNFVVAWDSYFQDGSDRGVFAQRYSSSGAPHGTEFRVNTYTTYSQYRPHVAADASGSFAAERSDGAREGSPGRGDDHALLHRPVAAVAPGRARPGARRIGRASAGPSAA